MKYRREQIGKKLRFEVFKRDNFTCQYCGRKAPEIILEAFRLDHIHPVCEGGDNNIVNLATSCFDCNSGKGGRPLSSQATLEKQRKQMEELEERRQQLEMMMEWHNSLRKENRTKTDEVIDYLYEICPETLKEKQLVIIKKICRKYEFKEIFFVIDDIVDYYLYKTKEQYENASIEERLSNNYEEFFLCIFCKKLESTLKYREREKEDPEWSNILEIYRFHKDKNRLGRDYGFTLKLVDKVHGELRKIGYISRAIVKALCIEGRWESVQELNDCLNNTVIYKENKIPSTKPITLQTDTNSINNS